MRKGGEGGSNHRRRVLLWLRISTTHQIPALDIISLIQFPCRTSSKNQNLPLGLLNAAQGHPMLVELKNGETLNGHLIQCDTWMNLTLKEVIQTSPKADKFVRLPEVYVKGNNTNNTDSKADLEVAAVANREETTAEEVAIEVVAADEDKEEAGAGAGVREGPYRDTKLMRRRRTRRGFPSTTSISHNNECGMAYVELT
ncbi:hypothetical protein F5B20DRAFT_577783 [Whalleya microplaca]|nr:hypothetical protein F5B20DRAFT_577783 [Whalleya microplaca]